MKRFSLNNAWICVTDMRDGIIHLYVLVCKATLQTQMIRLWPNLFIEEFDVNPIMGLIWRTNEFS